MVKLVAYLRVSTDSQGADGLGIAAQRAAVQSYAASNGAEIAAEFVEVQTGTDDNRPQFAAAMATCRKLKATFTIARLDRASRRAAFLLNLRDAGVPIVICDAPHANKTFIGFMAVMAEDERDRIAARTKAALQAAKARGVRLGNPTPGPSAARGRASQASQADQFAANILPIVHAIQAAGVTTLAGIAGALNARGVRTARGGQWYAGTVANIIARSA